jgi:effector-binding domain-containing protein
VAYTIEVKQLPAQHLAVVKFRAGTANMGQHMGEAFGAVMGYLGRNGMQPVGPPLAQYEPVADEFDTAAGFPVASPVAGDGHVVPLEFPACEAAVTEHVGPYPELSHAYEAIMAWIAANNREADGTVSWEQYLNDPSTPTAELRTTVMMPLKPR